jgi:hypothetical protein
MNRAHHDHPARSPSYERHETRAIPMSLRTVIVAVNAQLLKIKPR